MGVERTPNESQHAELILEKKILPPLLPGFEHATFRSRVRRSNQQAIPAYHTLLQTSRLHSIRKMSSLRLISWQEMHQLRFFPMTLH